MGFLKGALSVLKIAKKVASKADILPGGVGDVVTAGKSIVKTVTKGKERFTLDETSGQKVARGAVVSAAGGGLGFTVVMIAIECGLIPDAILALPTTFAALVTASTVVASILTNLVRKWMAKHPDIQVAVDDALAGGGS